MIKVAFFADMLIADFDGAARTMFQLIHRIESDKFEFFFIYGDGPKQIYQHKSLKIPSLAIPINKNYSMAIPALAKQLIKQELEQFNPDIIHIASPSLLGNFALKYAEKNNIPTISIYHTHFISYIDYYLKSFPFLIHKTKNQLKKIQVAFYNRCHQIYIPSISIAEELQDMGIAEKRMKIWRRGINKELFSPKKKDKKLLTLITKNNKPNILFASRLVWEKNLHILIEIYRACELYEIDCNFIIAGEGKAMQACQLAMPNAFFLGNLDHENLAEVYASSTLFLFPSVTETYGNVVLEAMSSGLPCLIADGGGSADHIEHGVNGYKCDPHNVMDYVRKIKSLLADKPLRTYFKQQGLQHSKQFNWDTLADEYFAGLIQSVDEKKIKLQSDF